MVDVKYIVLTMSENGLGNLPARLPDGYQIVNFPLIGIQPLEVQANIFSAALGSDWMVFTSQNAVNCFLTNLKKYDLNRENSKASVAAIGPRTAEALSTNGIRVHFIPTRSNRVILSKELPASEGQEVSIFTSEQTRKSEYSLIEQKGATTRFNFLYRTVRLDQEREKWNKMFGLPPSVFCFLSPSAVNSFFDQLRDFEIQVKPDDFTWGAIGPGTSRELKKVINSRVVQPESSTLNSLLQAIWKAT